jgi:hypothetical protein
LIPSKFGVYNVAKDSVYFINFLLGAIFKMYQNILNCMRKIKNLRKKNKLIIVQEPVYNDDGSDAVSEIK